MPESTSDSRVTSMATAMALCAGLFNSSAAALAAAALRSAMATFAPASANVRAISLSMRLIFELRPDHLSGAYDGTRLLLGHQHHALATCRARRGAAPERLRLAPGQR